MYDVYLWLAIISSFVVGGIWIALTTVIADRFGSRIGGFVVGLPSTVVVTLLFVGISQGTSAAVQATTVIPLSVGTAALFLVTFAFLSRKNFYIGLFCALAVWFALAGLIVLSNADNFAYALLIYVLVFLISYIVLEIVLGLKSQKKAKIKYSLLQLLLRAVFAGSVIAFAVFITKAGGPIYGGIFSAFPAAYLPTLIILRRSRGVEFARSATKSMLTGALSVIVYITGVRYTYPIEGMLLGTIISFIVSMAFAYLVYRFITSRMS